MAGNNRRVSFSQNEEQRYRSHSTHRALSNTDLNDDPSRSEATFFDVLQRDTEEETPTEHLENSAATSPPVSTPSQRQKSTLKVSTTKHRRDSKRTKSAASSDNAERKQLLDPADRENQDCSSQSLLLVPVEVLEFVRLRRLILSHNNLSGLPAAICSLTNLEYLDVSCNPLVLEDDATDECCLPEEFYLLTNLHTLILKDCGLWQIPAVVWNTISLQILDLSRNKVGYVAGDVGNLINIRRLRLCWMDLQTLPPEIGVCDQLESIDLMGNPLETLPETLVECPQLFELKLKYQDFQKLLDEYIVQLIDEGKMQSQHIPSVIFELGNLRALDLDQTKINFIPIEHTLFHLTELRLAHNSFLEIPESVCTMVQLSVLDMSYNHIRAIPDYLIHLKRLERLSLSNNGLTTLSATLALLPNLRTLVVSHNQIHTIERKLSQSRSLLGLDLSYNYLTSLPYEFCELTQLATLDLRYNRLEYLPWSARQMTGLTSMNCFDDALRRTGLHLLGNPIVDPPSHVWQSTNIQALFSYLETMEKHRSNSFHHLKLILIGPKNSGKTALAVRLLHHRKMVSTRRTTLDVHVSLLQGKGQSTSTGSGTVHGSHRAVGRTYPPSVRTYLSTERIMHVFQKSTFTTTNNLYCTIFDVTSESSYEILYPFIYDANALYILSIDLTSLLNALPHNVHSNVIHGDEDQPVLVDIASLITEEWLYSHIFHYLVAISDHCEQVFIAIVGLLRDPHLTTTAEHAQTILTEIHSRVNVFLADVGDQRQNINHYSHFFPTPIHLSHEDMITLLIEQLETIAQQWNFRHHKLKRHFIKQRLGFHHDHALVSNYGTCLEYFQEHTQWSSLALDDDDDDEIESNRLVIEEEINQMSFGECLDYLQLTGDILRFGRPPHQIILRQPYYLMNKIFASTLFRPDLHRWLDYHTNVVFRYSGYYPSEELFQLDRQRLLTNGEFTWRMLKVLFYERTAHNIDVSESSLFEYCRLMQRLYLGYLHGPESSDRSWTTSCFVCPWLASGIHCSAGDAHQTQQNERLLEDEHSTASSALRTIRILNYPSSALPSGLYERLLVCLYSLLNKRFDGARLTLEQAADIRLIQIKHVDDTRQIHLTVHHDLLDSVETLLRQRLFSLYPSIDLRIETCS